MKNLHESWENVDRRYENYDYTMDYELRISEISEKEIRSLLTFCAFCEMDEILTLGDS